ncbi:ser/thr kinase [Monkeypox virus]|uniref:Serine/threonine-protein kinase n=1 Tax=Monkeypox virus TaxID=10244 RepID=Q3I8X4_MONPV|nr:ser/thr kinase [Monkeypox virus]ADK39065.1 ser/thr kinase [Monkeypox virus]ADX22689.1 ser/thr kinase [Monkeypox virus]ADX22885.1 ser/thr kinase [Monkeypox virus]
MGVANDSSPEYRWMSPHRLSDTVILGDCLYFNNIMSQLDLHQNWAPSVRLLNYFKNFNKETLLKIEENDYINSSFFQQKDKRFYPINDDFYHISTGGYGIVFKIDNYVVKFVFEATKLYSPMETTAEFTVPKFLYNNLKGDEKKLIVCAWAMGLNYKLTFLHTLYKRVLHMLLLLIQTMDGQELSLRYSSKVFLKAFNERKDSIKFVKLLSHFYPAVINSNINVINYFNRMFHFFEHEKRTNYEYERGNIIIFPLALYSADKVDTELAIKLGFKSLVQYIKFIFLQMSLLYIKIYELPCCDNFLHADLKPDNILLFDSNEPIIIHLKNKKFVFNERIKSALNDFDFSQVAGIINKKIKNNFKVEHNWYYDFHFFVHTLLKTYPEIEKDIEFSTALEEFIMCTKTDCDKYRLKVSILHPISFLEKFIMRDIFSDWINGGN